MGDLDSGWIALFSFAFQGNESRGTTAASLSLVMAKVKLGYMREQLEYMMIPQCKNSSSQSIRREVDLAWLAGIIDGEGNVNPCVCKKSNGSDYLEPTIRIGNTDLRMIEKIAQIYENEGLHFFYVIAKRKKYNPNWKDQLVITVASQASTKKLLNLVMPYLVNKKKMAELVIELIDYASEAKWSGNGKGGNYTTHPEFQQILGAVQLEKDFYIDPSETKRRAGKVFSW